MSRTTGWSVTAFLLVLLIIVAGCSARRGKSEEGYIIYTEIVHQPIDHDGGTGKSFDQRVKVLIPKEVSSEPFVLFVLGNESAISDEKLSRLYRVYGERKDMVLINPEHRGYGQSLSEDPDQSIPSYVTIAQALADYHEVSVRYRERFSGPWVAAGYSYGGALAINYGYRYPEDVQVVLSSSGVVDWSFLLKSYDIQARENIGDALFRRLAVHAGNLQPLEPFDENWQARELLYAFIVGISQYKENDGALKSLIGFLSRLPTKSFIAALRFLDKRFVKNAASNYAAANSMRMFSRDEVLTGKYDWRVWRYQQATETGTFWESSYPEGIFRTSYEDWIRECGLLFNEQPPLLKRERWRVDQMVEQLKVPLVYVCGGKDPWKFVCLPETYTINNGVYLYFENAFHCPDREPPEAHGVASGLMIIEEVVKRLQF